MAAASKAFVSSNPIEILLFEAAERRRVQARNRGLGIAGGVIAALAAEAAAASDEFGADRPQDQANAPVAASLDDILNFAKICATRDDAFGHAGSHDPFTPYFAHQTSKLGSFAPHAHAAASEATNHQEHGATTSSAHAGHEGVAAAHAEHALAGDPIMAFNEMSSHGHATPDHEAQTSHGAEHSAPDAAGTERAAMVDAPHEHGANIDAMLDALAAGAVGDAHLHAHDDRQNIAQGDQNDQPQGSGAVLPPDSADVDPLTPEPEVEVSASASGADAHYHLALDQPPVEPIQVVAEI